MQLSLVRYKAIGVERGANLDAIDAPLNNRAWFEAQFAVIRLLTAEHERLQAIDAIVRRTDPGPGGFYDDPGNPSRQPHLVPGPGLEADPMQRQTRVGLGSRRAGLSPGVRTPRVSMMPRSGCVTWTSIRQPAIG